MSFALSPDDAELAALDGVDTFDELLRFDVRRDLGGCGCGARASSGFVIAALQKATNGTDLGNRAIDFPYLSADDASRSGRNR